ncbi:phosphotransferase enzyme family protein [Arenibacter sp. 6A1]|uniref:phosphotransferase enzyme family protein n=1 Tax=Arenibacter sp. 6A1 TaxID=2720391 RepID=UPI001F0F3CC5|nr:aminoglycoside phosphotransferase family protein [Arenibacter sp. 6A1]
MMATKNDTINGVLGNFRIEPKEYQLQTINQGYINDTYLVMDGTTPLYIFQRINQNVFQNVKGIMDNIEDAFSYLVDPTYSTIELVKTESGATYFKEEEGGYWRLMTYIGNSTAYDNATDTKIAQEAGRIVGKFHQLLADASIENYVDTIPRFHDLSLRQQQFEEALVNADPKKLAISKDAIVFAKDTLEKLKALNNAELPLRVCHNDTKLNNILFSKEDDKALCLIDLDTVMKGYFYYDFGDAIRTIANTASEDEQDHSKITFEQNLFEAFVEGLAVNGAFLTKEEISLLPWGAVFMPFIHGLRALTDYLNNNIYYKVSYENQNLDRSLSLFDFTKKALSHIDYMQKVVENKLVPIQ